MFPQPLGLDLPEEVSPSVADQGAPVMTCPRGKFLWRTEGSGEKKPYLHQVPTANHSVSNNNKIRHPLWRCWI